MNWDQLKCRFGCDHPVAALVHAPGGCWCFRDEIQALCTQHLLKGLNNNANMSVLLTRTAVEHIARAANALIDVISQSNELTAMFVRHGDLWREFIDTLE